MRNITLILIGIIAGAYFIGLMGLGGCATTGSVTGGVNYGFMDRKGEERLVKKNNDLYIENLDRNEGRRITNTPDIEEWRAFFSKDGKQILYSTEVSHFFGLDYNHYRQPVNGDDSQRIEIDFKELLNLKENE